MSYRLLLDLEVVEFIAALPRRVQIQLRRRLGELQSSPRALRRLPGTRPHQAACSTFTSTAALPSTTGKTSPTAM